MKTPFPSLLESFLARYMSKRRTIVVPVGILHNVIISNVSHAINVTPQDQQRISQTQLFPAL